jgi:hypothetical protein
LNPAAQMQKPPDGSALGLLLSRLQCVRPVPRTEDHSPQRWECECPNPDHDGDLMTAVVWQEADGSFGLECEDGCGAAALMDWWQPEERTDPPRTPASLPKPQNVRVPPQALDAERSLLGGLLLDIKQLDEVRSVVGAGDFYAEKHRKVFEAMQRLSSRKEPIDRVTVKNELPAQGIFAAVGGDDFIDLLDKLVPSASNLAYYAKIVREKAILRRLIEVSHDIAVAGYEQQGDAGELLDAAQKRLLEIGETGHGGKTVALESAWSPFTQEQLLGDPPPLRFILRPYIPEGVVFNLSGSGASLKTTLTVYIAVCRALGLPFFGGDKPAEGETVLFTTEDRRDDYLRKLAALRMELGDVFDVKRVAERVHLFDCSGMPVRMVAALHGQYLPTGFADDLATVLKKKAPRADLIFMETVSRLAGGAETNESLSILVESGQLLCRRAGVSLGLVGHVSQDAGRNGTADQYAPRGGSAFGDNGRSTMVLTRLSESNRKLFVPNHEIAAADFERLLVLAHPKSNGAPAASPLILERGTTPYAPVLRLAELGTQKAESAALKEVNRLGQLEKLRGLVERLTLTGAKVTERLLRENYSKEIDPDLAQGKVKGRVQEALDAGLLRTGEKTKGGGIQLFAVPRATADRTEAT